MCIIWNEDVAHEKFMMITKTEARVPCEFPSTSLLPDSLTGRKHRANKASKREE